jgi:methyl-accepting chemotaxis protein
MKRKLFQILLMGAVTVSLGLFVSCKDTNEELYNQLKIQVDTNSPLYELKADHQKSVDSLRNELTTALALIKQCECDTTLMPDLRKLLDDLDNTYTMPDGSTFNSMSGLIDYITNLSTNYYNYTTTVGVTEDELKKALALATDSIAKVLRGEMTGGDSCGCDLSKIDSIEKIAIQALDKAKVALHRLDSIEPILKTTKELAENAADSAKAAANLAKAAGDSAAAALKLARDLEKIAKAADKLSKANADSIKLINKNITNIYERFTTISDSLSEVYKYADSIWAMADYNKQFIEKLNQQVKNDSADLADLKNVKIPGLEGKIDTLFDKVDSLGNEVTDLKDEIKKLYTYADANLEKAKAYTDTEIALLRADLNGIDVDLEALRKEFRDSVFNLREDLNEYVDSVKDALQSIAELKGAVSLINDSLGKLDNRINENTLKIGEVDHKLDSIADDLKDSIAALRKDLSDLEKRVKKNEEDIQALREDVDFIQENLKRMVTGIIVQATKNPAFGSVNLPFGTQSNVLLAYYGKAGYTGKFPSNDPNECHYVDGNVLTWTDIQMMKKSSDFEFFEFEEGDVIFQNEDANAGTLYLTVNPNTVDFSKLQLNLENSQGVPSYIKLGALKKSDATLQLGFTRAADNGFYEAPAYLRKEDINKVQKINFDVASLKDAVSEILNKRSSADPSKVATDLANVLNSLRLDANAVKCEWTDTAKAGETPQKHAVYSNYNLAATAAKPLNLNSYNNLHYQTLPGYERLMKYLDRASNKIQSQITIIFDSIKAQPTVKKVYELTINKVEIPKLDEPTLQQFYINKEIIIDGLEYTLGTMDVKIPIQLKGTADLGTPTITVPSLQVDGTGNTASVLVKIYKDDSLPEGTGPGQLDNPANVVGYATIPAQNVIVNGTASGTASVTIGNQTFDINQTLETTIEMNKVLKFGDLDEDNNPTSTKTFVVTVDMRDAVQALWGNVQTSVGGVNETLVKVEDIVTDVQKLIDELDNYNERINAKVDGYMKKISDYITKINNKICNWINDINHRFQPVLVASDDKGTKFLSMAKSRPSELTGNVTFVPTTWTLELAVPLAKKHIAVTDVIKGSMSAKGGDTTCLGLLTKANSAENMNKVVSGDLRSAQVSGLESGYVYEVAYTALDFYGNVSTKKYYIKVK